MGDLTLFLGGIAVFLFVAVAIVSIVPRKQRVNVKFIPPSPVRNPDVPSTQALTMTAPDTLRPVNVKIVQLFSRLEEIEKRLLHVEKIVNGSDDTAWLETVPVRVTHSQKEKIELGE